MRRTDYEALSAREGAAFKKTDPHTLGDLMRRLRATLAREPVLTILGLAGLVIAGLCLAIVAVRGAVIPPEGKMLDAAIFSFGVGLFILTTALLLPLAGFTPRGRRLWRRLSYSFFVFSFVLEPVQAFRGLDPRFAEAGVDLVLGIVWGLTAGLVVVLAVILGLRFFRKDVLTHRTLLRTAIRYGMVAVWVSFGVGVVMAFIGGREIGNEGNLMLSHALGVHGIQTIPLVALLLVWAGYGPGARTWILVAGVGWLIACFASMVQALLGQSPLQMSVLGVMTVVGLLTWTAAAGRAVAGAWGHYTTARGQSAAA
ncbi:MAG: hypothetical protein GEU79_19360 [Acidimicrobiia bacterium]|nr:hypothetical protein [Acidimicrobiia bacterium]